MHTYVIQKATTDVSIELEIIDDTDGTPETGVVFNTAGIDLQYRRDGAVSVAITEADLATPALTDAHADGGFLHIGNGVYRFDLPDAACATGVDKVVVHGTVTGMVVIPCVIQLVSYDPFDAVRMGMTALPNAAAEAAGGLYTRGTGAGQVNQDANGRIDTNAAAISGDATAADNAESFFDGTGYAGANNVIPTVTTLTNKTGFSLAATGLDAITEAATGMVEIAKAVWNRVLTGATHNIVNSAGRDLRQIEATFVVHEGTAQAGGPAFITLAAGASSSDNIYRGDRVTIVDGTGAGEHDIIIAYDGATKVATVAEGWIITPDATSVYELTPATVDVETWQHNVITGDGDWAALATSLATAQADLDIITGADGVNLLSATQSTIDAIPTSAEVNAEVKDVTDTDTHAEPSAVVAATTSIKDAIMWVKTFARNKLTQTATAQTLRNDADSADIAASTVSDDGTTATRNEFI